MTKNNITHFQKFKKQQLKKRNKAKTLCNHGFHQWHIIQKEQFDNKQGKLVTIFQCKHCGIIKNKLL
jgi:hypothetical protein